MVTTASSESVANASLFTTVIYMTLPSKRAEFPGCVHNTLSLFFFRIGGGVGGTFFADAWVLWTKYSCHVFSASTVLLTASAFLFSSTVCLVCCDATFAGESTPPEPPALAESCPSLQSKPKSHRGCPGRGIVLSAGQQPSSTRHRTGVSPSLRRVLALVTPVGGGVCTASGSVFYRSSSFNMVPRLRIDCIYWWIPGLE